VATVAPHPRCGAAIIFRAGYAAKGMVSLIVGGLAVLAALKLGGPATGTTGAIREWVGQPFGGILLIVLALGLLGHVVWRLTQAIGDAEDKGYGFNGPGRSRRLRHQRLYVRGDLRHLGGYLSECVQW